ncbi:phosphatidylglycerol:prolipoprotein diacylglycerol transferase [Parabacteroides sp. PFB2-12]|uniref:prolipoprotein diacylglyceryl transferase n=1 Tax=unclassified Parabacteroides TaxID=2649774 RepID=UPI002474EBAB|nr:MULTISPECIES: prolipoprotein diacylglyceryl transferase [unclassified Parabacteroides]MDH6341606.1 phosphatidylglycerol:prolipoprotein diacylglycerol transferase [Parabacteroides sp. PM6-13]MDH6389971.1 phosphatidylglycerol:prolipoprotein diacylglycerol transferase [Parabacteroides sp. PFB2-12]
MILLPVNAITWTVDPVALTIGSYSLHWYTLAFLIGFAVGYMIVDRMWKKEDLPRPWLEPLLIYTMVGTLVGARLGHCLFYEPAYYLAHPLEIILPFEMIDGSWKLVGFKGLASHGGTLGIILATYFYSRKVSHKSMLWTFDRLVVPTGLVAALIRLGNLMNHEIYGHPTDLPWGFRFIRNIPYWQQGAEPIFTLPSHPTQLYEAICYLITFALCMWLYFRKEAWKKEGFIFGIFLICIFGARILIEFLKNNQEAFEEGMFLNMGQLLSIPFVLAGICFVWRAENKKKNNVKT